MGTNINVHGVAKVADNVDLEALLLVGAGNSKWLPMMYGGHYNLTTPGTKAVEYDGWHWANVGVDDYLLNFVLSKAITLGSKTLHVKAVRFGLNGANATNKVLEIIATKISETAEVDIDNDVTDRTAPGVYTLTFSSAESMVGFNLLTFLAECDVANATALRFAFVEADVYYD